MWQTHQQQSERCECMSVQTGDAVVSVWLPFCGARLQFCCPMRRQKFVISIIFRSFWMRSMVWRAASYIDDSCERNMRQLEERHKKKRQKSESAAVPKRKRAQLRTAPMVC